MAPNDADGSGLKIRLLGGVAAESADGSPIDVGPAKCQAVLAALALSASSSVPMWRLVESVWSDSPPRTAERTLQSYIARLRRELGQDLITRTGASYRLNLPPDAVDVLRFVRHLEEGKVDDALAEWSGPPLVGIEAPGLDSTVVGLTEQWLGAVELDLERQVDTDPASTIGRLTNLTATHPFREGLWGLLMTALYRVGRQADALAAFRTARRQLIDELGVEPGPRLQDLELQILSHAGELNSVGPEQSPASTLPTGTVTFAFAQVEDAPNESGRHREQMPGAMARFHDTVREAAARHEGEIFIRGGDAIGAVFTGAHRAADWAAELHRALASDPGPGGVRLTARIGIHTGEAEQHGGTYYGPAVNIASRLAGAGHGNQTLSSSTTAGLLDDVACSDLGWYRLDGVVSEQQIFQLDTGSHPPLRLEDLYRGNLPHRPGRLIGREDDLDAVVQALETYPVVTLVGPGGIGKTSLALTVAERAAVGEDAWLIELAEIDSPNQVLHAVADTLGVAEREGATLVEAIIDTFRSRPALFVLDNCEHVADAAAELAEALARGCRRLRLVATSRERLGVSNERIITVPPLDPGGSAIDLFIERASATSAHFDPVADLPAVEEICRRLDGIPLAIELAAARISTLSPGELAERLGHRLRLLDGTRRTGNDRHRTLRSAVQWSYDLLGLSEQSLFLRLSIFAGPFGLAAAERVAAGSDQAEVDDIVNRLVEQSMLTVESGPFGRRFRLLEPIRQFASDQLDSAEEQDLAARHADWCLAEVSEIGGLLAGWSELEGVARLTELWPNLRAAFDRACTTETRDVARALVRPILSEIVLRSNYEIGDWLEELLAVTPPDDEEGVIFGLYWAAHRYAVRQDRAAYEQLVARYGEPDHLLMRHARAYVIGDYEGQEIWAPEAAAELRRTGDDHLAERADINLATAWLNLGRFEDCDARLRELLAHYREQGPPTFLNWTFLLLGYSASFQGMQDEADGYFDQAISVELPPRTHTPNKPLEARAAFRRGNRVRAFRILRAHIDELLATQNMQASGIDCIEFINMMVSTGKLAEAGLMLDYLETTGLLDAPSWRTLIADAAELVAASRNGESPVNMVADDRSALEYMSGVLGLLSEPTGT